MRNFIDTHNLSPKGVTLTAEDIREGLTGVLSLFRNDNRVLGWDLWNEPDNRPAMWTGTDEEYFRLYSTAAKAICYELRKNRYVLSYLPQSVPYSEERRLLVMGEEGINARAKTMQPPN